MKRTAALLILLPLILTSPAAVAAKEPPTDEEVSLPIGLTEEEKGRLHEIGSRHQVTAAPTGVMRNPSEWEPSQGVLVRWPLGIPIGLVAEMSEDVVVTTIVPDPQTEIDARAAYSAGGVNLSNIDFIHAPTNSIWIRDYGPWFVFEDTNLAIVDHIYNRPRPLDDVIPQTIGTAWGLDVYGMDLIHTGGNHMSDGLGMSTSTELVYNENPSKSAAEVDQLMLDYLGNDYTVLEYIQSGGIHHIDCWAKFLGPSTVLVKDVAPTDPTYDELNARAAFLATQLSPWGVPYEVVRIFCPSGTYYTNSLILNDKVLVPLFGNSEDATALQTYQNAMPGYEVLGFSGSWASEDALHCRAMGVPDAGVLAIDHTPFRGEDITFGDYGIEARIVAHSGQALVPGDLKVHYSVDGGLWQETPLTPAGPPDAYQGTIPVQAEDSVVSYYLEAADASGRVEKHPYIGEPWAHEFTAICPNHPLVDVTPDGPAAVCAGSAQLMTAGLTGGVGPFSYQWLEDGAPIPGATSATFLASDSGSHAYNCEVRGDGCVNPRTDVDDVTLSWQLEPVFAGLAGVVNTQNATCTIDLSWVAATPACAGPVAYNVYRSTTPGFTPGPSSLLVAGLSGSDYSDTADLAYGTTYHYVVRAQDLSNGAEDFNTLELSDSPTGSGGGAQLLLEDDFDDPATWADWSVTTGPGPHTCGDWARVDTTSQRPPGSTGFYALADSDACGSGSSTSTDLLSPAVDGTIAGLVSVTLEFDLHYRYYDGDDTVVEVWDGSGWHAVWNAPASNAQSHHSVDVTAHAVGNPAFRVRFRYQNASWDYWFAVDNVVVTGTVGGACETAAISVSTVPDGSEGGTAPLRADRSGSDVSLTWDATTPGCASAGYHLIWGWGADVAGHVTSGSDCTLAATGSHVWASSPETSADWSWFLVVGDDGATTEGGWGTDSSGVQRSAGPSGQCDSVVLDAGACLP